MSSSILIFKELFMPNSQLITDSLESVIQILFLNVVVDNLGQLLIIKGIGCTQ